jgi:hypothetical protein
LLRKLLNAPFFLLLLLLLLRLPLLLLLLLLPNGEAPPAKGDSNLQGPVGAAGLAGDAGAAAAAAIGCAATASVAVPPTAEDTSWLLLKSPAAVLRLLRLL